MSESQAKVDNNQLGDSKSAPQNNKQVKDTTSNGKQNRKPANKPANDKRKPKNTNRKNNKSNNSRSNKNRGRGNQEQFRTSAYQLAVLPEKAEYFAPDEFNTPMKVGVALKVNTNDIKSWLNERYHRFANFYGYGVGGLVRAGAGAQVRRYDAFIDRVLSQSEYILNNTLAITQPIVDEYLEQFFCENMGGEKEVRKICFSNHYHLRYLRILEQLDALLTHINFLCLVGHIDTPAKLSMYHQWARLPRKIEQKLVMINKGIEEEFKCKLTGVGRTQDLVLPENRLADFVEKFSEKYASVTNRNYELSIVTSSQNQVDTKKIDHLSYQFYKEYTKQDKEDSGKEEKASAKTGGDNGVSSINARLKEL
ncbi:MULTISPECIES: hypothetical protein [Vibrio]|uniref:Uncharacterized protein n=2 Tax=Vibrio TaxID=662 RepID=A0A510IFR9_9VIBR|nr:MULTISPECIES: hypothetical protein [Vibrio]RTZ23006.1 hypothetical protein EKN09_11020 [Vibrio penaeicida]BBL92321.1 hypothetical protein VroAM7_49740 [Vibrio rotiferianus]GLQ71064.1 hypothetical protein GCM10007932_04240 [Vibrio penaeicida]